MPASPVPGAETLRPGPGPRCPDYPPHVSGTPHLRDAVARARDPPRVSVPAASSAWISTARPSMTRGHTRPSAAKTPLRSTPHRPPLSSGAAPRRVEGGGAGRGGSSWPSRPREGFLRPPWGGPAGRSQLGQGEGAVARGAPVGPGLGRPISQILTDTTPSPARGTQRCGPGGRAEEPRGADGLFRAALKLWRGGDGLGKQKGNCID